MRKRLYEIMEVADENDPVSRSFDLFIIGLIVINVCAVVLETVPVIRQAAPNLFLWIEVTSVAIFSVEYLARLWCCVENPEWRHPVTGRLRYMMSFHGIIDLLAILPFYVVLLGGDFRFMRIIRLFRIFRLLKLARYSAALNSFETVFRTRKAELVGTLMVLFVMLLFASSLMYFAEHEAQPEVFSSIPATMWWGMATLTTVGYGDVYPVTAMGKLLGGVVAVLGIGLFALPAGIISAAFLQELEIRRKDGKAE